MHEIKVGDAIEVLKRMPDQSINTCITSPPYWALRNYGMADQIGQENTPEEYIENLVNVFREVKRVLRDDGTLWLNLGDTYCGTGHKKHHRDPKYKEGRTGQEIALNNKIEGLKPKDMVGIPWAVAFALRADGWYLHSDIIWEKRNALPSPVKDRPTNAHEYIFLLSKSRRYYYDHEAIREPLASATLEDMENRKIFDNKGTHGGTRPDLARSRKDYVPSDGKRNKRTVWTVNTRGFKGAHFAVFPPELILPCVLAGCPEDGVVLDPFVGSGTTLLVATENNRRSIGIDINPEYAEIAEERLRSVQGKLF